jgi:hypothetical protein
VTRHPAAEPVENSIATLAAAGPTVNRHLRRASGNGPTRVLQALCDRAGTQPIGSVSGPATFLLAGVALDPVSSQPGSGQRAAPGEDVLLRLALWLADVAAQAALAAMAAGATAPHLGRTDEPPVSESAP